MQDIAAINWAELFLPSTNILGIIIRGSCLYLFVFFVMRVFRRESGSLSTADLLVVVFVADAAQNGMASDQKSIGDGILLVATIFAWNFLFDYLGYRFRWAHKLINPRPLILVNHGKINWSALRSQLLTRADLVEQLREHGVDNIRDVQRCYLESDGRISVVVKHDEEVAKR